MSMHHLSILRQILIDEWDPLNISGNPALSDEYDAFIPGLYRLLKTCTAQTQIEDYLNDAEHKLETAVDQSTRERAAALLFAHRQE